MLKFYVFLLLFFVLSVMLESINAAEILAVFPYPGLVHYYVALPYLKALAKRGHRLTVISPHAQEPKIENFHDITVHYPDYEQKLRSSIRGEIDRLDWNIEFSRNATLSVLNDRKVQKLMNRKKHHFDLVISDVMRVDSLHAFGPYFNAPLIGVSSYGTDPFIDPMVCNISPLSYILLPKSTYTGEMTLWKRICNFAEFAYECYFQHSPHFKDQEKFYRKYFRQLSTKYRLSQINSNFSLILLNQHFSISFPRPYVPNMIEVAGMYYDYEPRPLAEEINDFIAGSKNGVVYISLGPNIQNTDLDEDNLQIILKVMSHMNERIIWQLPSRIILNTPSNMLVGLALPQADILAHPQVKMFIANPDHRNTIEAIYHGKPIVGIPHYSTDQYVNMAWIEKLGFGVSIDYKNLTTENFKYILRKILRNSSYFENAKEISKRYHDRPMKPLDLAIYWTEYILRHKGAPFMKMFGKDLNAFEFRCIDCFNSFYFIVVSISLMAFMLLVDCIRNFNGNDMRYFIRNDNVIR